MPAGTPGAATVLGDGGDDLDTAFYDGTAAADQIAVTANLLVPRVDAAATAPFEAAGSTESLVLRGLGGNDTISAVGNLAASATRLTFDGGANDDTLLGSNGPDLLVGSSGNDHVDGQQNNDLARLGSGNDTFQWDPGDGNDTSRARPALTRSASTAPTSASCSTCRGTAGASASPATSPPSPSTSTTSSA